MNPNGNYNGMLQRIVELAGWPPQAQQSAYRQPRITFRYKKCFAAIPVGFRGNSDDLVTTFLILFIMIQPSFVSNAIERAGLCAGWEIAFRLPHLHKTQCQAFVVFVSYSCLLYFG